MITIKNKINPFLIVPKLYSDESLESFLWRLSYANGYDSLDWLKIFNLKKSLKKQGLNFIVDDSFYEQLSQFMGINKNELKKHTYLQCLRPFYSDEKVDFSSIYKKKKKFDDYHYKKYLVIPFEPEERFCPKCLEELSYHRLFWNSRYFSFCPIHNIRLLSRCTFCGDSLKIRNFINDRCDCGERISLNPSDPINNYYENVGMYYVSKLYGIERENIKYELDLKLEEIKVLINWLYELTVRPELRQHFKTRYRQDFFAN